MTYQICIVWLHIHAGPFYSSYDVRIRHDGAAFPALEKRLLAGWDVGRQHIRVMQHY
jgi:hypothetical protein